ncbi:hypothetical protein AAFP30_27915 [Gordonia sp. CPCC 205515]|uniref:hypothetical protein n=1 Tax=Gordonia sp. CPCC 205515 TaxID=3140791 RepID=UPI003AF38E7F
MKRLVTVLAAVLVLAGCGLISAPDDQPMDRLEDNYRMEVTEPSLPYDPPLGIDETSAQSVATGAVRIIYGWRFDRDTDSYAALLRATPLMTAPLANELRTVAPQPFVNYRTWEEWAAQNASTTVVATIAGEEHPADTEDEWRRKIGVELTVHAAGRPLHQWTFAVLITAQRQAGQWVIAEFRPLGV